MSLRSSERGLKFSSFLNIGCLWLSLRSSERGLKLSWCPLHSDILCRSVRRSVDWNCINPEAAHKRINVAPFVGAWIEIFQVVLSDNSSSSLRSSERGLKFLHLIYLILVKSRSVRRSVDWNTSTMVCLYGQRMSLRSSERGLKYRWLVGGRYGSFVAPFVGAWIEIRNWNSLGVTM